MNAAEKARIAREQANIEREVEQENLEEQRKIEKVRNQVLEIAKNKKWGTVTFGNYYKDVSKEPIEWLVLENYGDEITLVSKNVIDCYNFNDGDCNSYKESGIRAWLNGEFLDKAFNEYEQKFILDKEIESGCGISYASSVKTKDKVYLLNVLEVKKEKTLFGNKLLKCKPTKYAKSKSVYKANGKALWWGRDLCKYEYSRDCKTHYVTVANCFGKKRYTTQLESGYSSYETISVPYQLKKRIGVRPVITLKLGD